MTREGGNALFFVMAIPPMVSYGCIRPDVLAALHHAMNGIFAAILL